MNRIALGLEYDGSRFKGWQQQKTVISIQETVEMSLSKVANETISTVCAGRTDAGVHALCQVVHFDTTALRSERAWLWGGNAYLPPDIRILWVKPVSNHFNARQSACHRQYRYVIYNHSIRPALLQKRVGWYYLKLDVPKMRAAAQHWVGEHDFSSFRASGCQSRSPIRSVTNICITKQKDFVIIDIIANAFLHHMVRNMVGVLIKIGAGKAKPHWALEVLMAKDRRKAAMTAEASGLYLFSVNYPLMFGLPQYTNEAWFLRI